MSRDYRTICKMKNFSSTKKNREIRTVFIIYVFLLKISSKKGKKSEYLYGNKLKRIVFNVAFIKIYWSEFFFSILFMSPRCIIWFNLVRELYKLKSFFFFVEIWSAYRGYNLGKNIFFIILNFMCFWAVKRKRYRIGAKPNNYTARGPRHTHSLYTVNIYLYIISFQKLNYRSGIYPIMEQNKKEWNIIIHNYNMCISNLCRLTSKLYYDMRRSKFQYILIYKFWSCWKCSSRN